MRRSSRLGLAIFVLRPVAIAAVAMQFSGCAAKRAPTAATVMERHDIPPSDYMELADSRAFIAHAKAIANSDTQTGDIPISEFLMIMPLEPRQRAILSEAFPNSFSVSCNSGRCSATTSGTAAQAVMAVSISLISNPYLALESSVTTDFTVRNDDMVEFCNVRGMSVKKFFVTRAVQGLLLSIVDDRPILNVNVGDDRANYTCD